MPFKLFKFLFFSLSILLLGFTVCKGIKKHTKYYTKAVFIEGKKNTLINDKAFIQFEKNEIKCFTSCNWIKAKYKQRKNSISVFDLIRDSIPCPDGLIGIESDLLETLPKIDRYIVKGKKLILFAKSDTLLILNEQ